MRAAVLDAWTARRNAALDCWCGEPIQHSGWPVCADRAVPASGVAYRLPDDALLVQARAARRRWQEASEARNRAEVHWKGLLLEVVRRGLDDALYADLEVAANGDSAVSS
jgi:hypothetical protein